MRDETMRPGWEAQAAAACDGFAPCRRLVSEINQTLGLERLRLEGLFSQEGSGVGTPDHRRHRPAVDLANLTGPREVDVGPARARRRRLDPVRSRHGTRGGLAGAALASGDGRSERGGPVAGPD
nr:hypothetical protein [Actinoplanes atraurantiacus]